MQLARAGLDSSSVQWEILEAGIEGDTQQLHREPDQEHLRALGTALSSLPQGKWFLLPTPSPELSQGPVVSSSPGTLLPTLHATPQWMVSVLVILSSEDHCSPSFLWTFLV